jgi:hypothetical protein
VFHSPGLSQCNCITVLCPKYHYGFIFVNILIESVTSLLQSFLGWGETESTWYVGQ